MRGRGGFVRSTWEEVREIIAAANIHTIKTWGPDRIIGFSPIPAMSMVSYASGARYLSLIGGTLLSFYDWYCDLPPSSPQTWGEQTDVPESADWYNSGYIIAWGSNVPQTRTPDAHFFVEARYNGTTVVAITPDYSEVAKLSDLWLHPKQGTDAAFAMAMGHVILREFFLDRQVPYFQDYCRRYTDMPMLVRLRRQGDRYLPDRYVRQSDLPGAPTSDRAAWKSVAIGEKTGGLTVPQGSMGYRWPGKNDPKGRWNLEAKDGETGEDVSLRLSVIEDHDEVVSVAFPYFGGRPHERFPENNQGGDVLLRNIPAKRVTLADGETLVTTVFDLLCANYGLDRGLGGVCAKNYDDNVPYTPAWQAPITGMPAEKAIAVARGFADNAEKTHGRSMVIIGAGLNHWYHQDMNYRSITNLLMMCGTIGISGGGWAHYVGQEKLRPQTGWTMLTFALDWTRPPRHMNGTSFFYAHSDQWRYEKLEVGELLSPLADPAAYRGSFIDLNVRAERMGWLPSAPQLAVNPLTLAAEAEAGRVALKDHVVSGLKSGRLIRTIPKTSRAISSYGARTCSARPVRGTNISCAISSARVTACRARISARWAPRSPRRLLGATPRRRASSTLSSLWISACRRVVCIPTSCCRRRLGMRSTISTRRTCTPSSTRSPRQWTRYGSRAATGRSTRPSLGVSRSSCQATLGSSTTWY
jgi:nitrate reductase / nitrite oxidoreductase, alpha subunit